MKFLALCSVLLSHCLMPVPIAFNNHVPVCQFAELLKWMVLLCSTDVVDMMRFLLDEGAEPNAQYSNNNRYSDFAILVTLYLM